MDKMLSCLIHNFRLSGNAVSCERYGCGHINETYLVCTDAGRRYILQKVSAAAFKDIPGLMNNIILVTEWLSGINPDPRASLHLISTLDGGKYFVDDAGGYWRLYDFVEGTVCLQKPETMEEFAESATAFGGFQQSLAGFPAEKLVETIPHFHDTVDRYRIFHEVLKKDPVHRASGVQEEIAFYLSHEKEAGTLTAMQRQGLLPTRVTHNDTKLNNVLLDAQTHKTVCVIDLDTVMPGLSLYDFGDSIRFGAATAAEDELDLTRVHMDLAMYHAFAQAFLRACPGLTEQEKKMLPMGAKLMTLECGLRFLTDYLDGDHYFGITHPTHNLERSHTQMTLVRDMEEKWAEMQLC